MNERLTQWIRGFLVVAAILMVIGAFVALLGFEIPDKNRDAIMILIGALIARSEKIDAFFFGSSKSSEDKTAMLAREAPPADAREAAKDVAQAADDEAEQIALRTRE